MKKYNFNAGPSVLPDVVLELSILKEQVSPYSPYPTVHPSLTM